MVSTRVRRDDDVTDDVTRTCRRQSSAVCCFCCCQAVANCRCGLATVGHRSAWVDQLAWVVLWEITDNRPVSKMNTKKGHSYNGILMGFILVLFISFTTGVHCNCIISYYRIGKLTSFVITSFRPTSLIECHQHQLPLVTCYSRSYVWLRFKKSPCAVILLPWPITERIGVCIFLQSTCWLINNYDNQYWYICLFINKLRGWERKASTLPYTPWVKTRSSAIADGPRDA